MLWLTDSRWLGWDDGMMDDDGWMEGDSGGSGVVVVVVAVEGGGCGCLSALLGSGAATALLTLVMMIYDRFSPGQPRLNSTEPPEPILDRSNRRRPDAFWGWLSCWTRCRQIPFCPFLSPDGLSLLLFRRSLL